MKPVRTGDRTPRGAYERGGAGPHKDRRLKRMRTRSQQNKAAIREQQ